MKTKEFKNGAMVYMDDTAYNGMTTVLCRDPAGNIIDKIRCDNKRQANEYYKAFALLAKNS
jgi:hypothetical protein